VAHYPNSKIFSNIHAKISKLPPLPCPFLCFRGHDEKAQPDGHPFTWGFEGGGSWVIAGVVTGEDEDEREGCGGESGWICTGEGIVGGWMRNGEMFMK
jgi:hypothetical protein